MSDGNFDNNRPTDPFEATQKLLLLRPLQGTKLVLALPWTSPVLASGCTVGTMYPTKPLGVGYVGAKTIEKMIVNCKLRPASKKPSDPSRGSGGGRGGDGPSTSSSRAVGGKAGAAAVSKPTTGSGIKELNAQNSSGDGKGVALAPEMTSSPTTTMDGKDEDGKERGDSQVNHQSKNDKS